MDLSRIRELIKVATEAEAVEVEIEEQGVRIIVRKETPTVALQPPLVMTTIGQPQVIPSPMAVPAPPVSPAPQPTPSVAPAQDDTVSVTIEAPTPGTYYSSPSPDAPPFVSVGNEVKPGDTLCIIEAMKLMNEIDCEVRGTIQEVLVEDAEPVEYGQPLFVIEPA